MTTRGDSPSRRSASVAARLAAVVFALGLAASFAQDARLGLADNGDFTRLMQCVVSRPEAYAINAPPFGTPQYDLRFYKFWISQWHIDLDLGKFGSTAALLWLPAVLTSVAAHSSVVSLTAIGAGLEAVVVGLYLALLLSLADDPLVMGTVAAGFGFMLATCDYAAYYNSFYSEAASSVYFFLLLFALGACVLKPSPVRIGCVFVAAALLGASKLQSSYLWLVSIAPILWIFYRNGTLNVRRAILIVVTASAIGIPPIANVWYRSNQLALFHYNDYDRTFDGILTFSSDPRAALASVGAADPGCVGTIAFEPEGIRCAQRYPGAMSAASDLRLLVREPLIVARMIGFAADSMQDISLEYLGKYERGDPRAIALPASGPSSWASAANRDYYTQYPAPPGNGWSHVKYALFPRGWALLAYLAAAAIFFCTVRGSPRLDAFRACGVLALVTCATQLPVDVFGDGREEIIKHLYLANVAFDASLILLAATAVCAGRSVMMLRSGRSIDAARRTSFEFRLRARSSGASPAGAAVRNP